MLALVGVEDAVVLAGDDRGDVGRHRLGLGEVPHRGAVAGLDRRRSRSVGDDDPVGRSGHVEGEPALEVGLLEGGEDAAGVGHLELAVEVDPVVDGVHEAVEALATAAVGAVGDHDQLVVRREVGERDPAVGVRRRGVDRPPVERDRVDGRVDEVHEGVAARLAAGEPQRRGGAERRRPRGEVEIDRVGGDVEQCGAAGGLVTREVGPGHAANHHRAHVSNPIPGCPCAGVAHGAVRASGTEEKIGTKVVRASLTSG